MQYVNTLNIPQELKELDQWVLWRYDRRDGDKTKVPYQASGLKAEANNPKTWSSFEKVHRGYGAGNWEGLGFEFSVDDPYTGIDLDGCRNPKTKVIEPWAKELILELASYAEVSPSSTGVKIWVRGNWNYDSGHKVFIKDVAAIEGKKAAIEIYDSGRYFAMTGARLVGQSQIADRQDILDQLRKRYWPDVPAIRNNAEWRSEASVLDRARKYVATIPGAVSGSGGHDATFKVACTLVLGFELPESDALQLLEEWNQSCQPQWKPHELKHKIRSASQQGGERGYLRNIAPKNYGTVPTPEYKPRIEVKGEAPPAEPVDEVKESLLEDVTRKALADTISGSIRLVELGLPEIDFALDGGVEPGEMIVSAGRPSHGKSVIGQQAIHFLTAKGVPCLFISEDMTSRSIGKRTIQFASEIHRDNWSQRENDVTYDIDAHFENRAPCYILEQCRTSARVAIEVKRMVNDNGVGLVVVDYAQNLQGIGKTRYDQQTNVSRVMKQIGQECRVPMIVLSQLSRKFEDRKPPLPQMSDLKETGALEQDADVILFQVWPWKLDSQIDPHIYHLFVAKNRDREIRKAFITCTFEPGRQRLVGSRESWQGLPSNLFMEKPEINNSLSLPDFEHGEETLGDF